MTPSAWHARAVLPEWHRLVGGPGTPALFEVAMVEDLPEPARRWLLHAIAPGTPLWPSTELTMHGTIRLGAWRRFAATQVLAPPDGFIWAATAHVLGLPVVGYDRLSSGNATMRWWLLGVVPVVSAEGPDIARSAAGRLASEIVLAPTAYRGATWVAGDRPDTVVGIWHIGGKEQRVELHVGPRGEVRDVVIQRWGKPPGAPYGCYPFGVTVEAERTFDGITLPSVLRAGWWWGTDRQDEGEFFRAEITDACRGCCPSEPTSTARPRDMTMTPAGRLLRAAHVLVAGVELASLGYVWTCALTGRRGRAMWVAVTALVAEGAALGIGRGDCPLGPLQQRLGDPVPLFELVLPRRAARAAVPALTGVACLGLAVIAARSAAGRDAAGTPAIGTFGPCRVGSEPVSHPASPRRRWGQQIGRLHEHAERRAAGGRRGRRVRVSAERGPVGSR